MAKYRKKPVVQDGEQFDGSVKSAQLICDWANKGEVICSFVTTDGQRADNFIVHTPEDEMRAEKGDWIMKGTAGEFYPVKEKIFPDIYEKVVD